MSFACHNPFAFGLNAVAISDIHLLNLPARDLSSRLYNTELTCMGYCVANCIKFSKISKVLGNRKPNTLQGSTLVPFSKNGDNSVTYLELSIHNGNRITGQIEEDVKTDEISMLLH